MRSSSIRRVATAAVLALSLGAVSVTAAHAVVPTATITVDAPATGIGGTDVPVKITFKDPSDAPVVGATVRLGQWDDVPLPWTCVTGADGSCTIQVPMSGSWALKAASDPSGPYPGISTDVFAIQRQVPTTLTLVQEYPQTPVEIGAGIIGLTAKLTETVTGNPASGGGTVSFVRTDVVPHTVITQPLDVRGTAYISPYPDETHATWKATFGGIGDLLASESAPIDIVSLVRTPTVKMDVDFLPNVVNAGQTVTITGKVTRYDLSPVQGLTGELWSRDSTLGTATKVGETTSGADGVLSMTITPHRSKIYEWRHPAGQGDYIAATSGVRPVGVKVGPVLQLTTAPQAVYDYATAPDTVNATVRLVDYWGDPLVGQSVGFLQGALLSPFATTDADGYATITFPTPKAFGPPGSYTVHYKGFTDAIYGALNPVDSPSFSVTVNHTATLSGAAAPAAPFLGTTFKVTGSLTVDGSASNGGVYATLWRKSSTSAWEQLGGANALGGVLSFTTTALPGTYTYQWRLAAAYGITPQTSNDVVVTSNPLVPTKIVAGIQHPVVVTGASTTVGASFGRADGLPESSTHKFELWTSVAKGSWARLATLTTTSAQPYIAVRPAANTRYQWRYLHTAGPASSSSNIVSVTVVPTISAKLSKSTVKRKKTVTLSGVVSPHRAGVKVYLMKGSTRLATATTKAGGKYSFSLKFTSKGTRTLHVVVPSQNAVASTKSRSLKLKVT